MPPDGLLLVARWWQTHKVAVDSPVCLPPELEMQPWWEVPRKSPISANVSSIHFEARLDGTWTGFQMGYRLDDAEFTWSERIDQGTLVMDIPVLPGQTESEGQRWTFAMRSRLLEGQECTSGISSGAYDVFAFASSAPPPDT